MFLRCGLVVVLLAWMMSARAEVSVQFEQQGYPVAVRTDETLRQALDRSSPIRQRGQVFYGQTLWQVHWQFWWQPTPQRCAIERTAIQVEVQMQLPEWTSGRADQRAEFDAFVAALERHERGHQQLAEAAGRAIDDALLAMPPADNCAQLEVQAKTLAQRVLDDYREREFDYDFRTNHGETQGAWLK
ncbi:DUF922 domain-containing Zn-dependent protease [Saccharospirillum mangrovi]|uniref:DUF922 domain-containing Zn-dependent protease n=1 Tax=Saccharospirillum mangrovi TaxID=2161747 RepID=UPI0013004DBF|nr:DUF922 domain-containing protein [Saccharospirillum mangrovi]